MYVTSNASSTNERGKLASTSSANFIKMVVRGRCCPSTGTKCAVTTAGKPALSRTPFKVEEKRMHIRIFVHQLINAYKITTALTLTIPATNAPQLNVPISFGIEINLQTGEMFWRKSSVGLNVKQNTASCNVALRMIGNKHIITCLQGAPSH